MSAPTPQHEPLNAAASLRVLIDLHRMLAPILASDLATQAAQAIRYLNTSNQEVEFDGNERWRGPDGRETQSVYIRVSDKYAAESVRSGECFIAQDVYGNYCHYWGREDIPASDRILSTEEALMIVAGREGL